jgi:hypothetical protein
VILSENHIADFARARLALPGRGADAISVADRRQAQEGGVRSAGRTSGVSKGEVAKVVDEAAARSRHMVFVNFINNGDFWFHCFAGAGARFSYFSNKSRHSTKKNLSALSPFRRL